jgi:hypothetical protein
VVEDDGVARTEIGDLDTQAEQRNVDRRNRHRTRERSGALHLQALGARRAELRELDLRLGHSDAGSAEIANVADQVEIDVGLREIEVPPAIFDGSL